HPVLRENCAACHGVNQNPKHSVADAGQALMTIRNYQLINFEFPDKSRLVTMILSNHHGIPTTLASQIQLNIEAMITPADADVDAPMVAVSAPASGAVLSGTVNMEAIATDNIGVKGVQFYLNGTAVGSEDLTQPFAVTLNTQF